MFDELDARPDPKRLEHFAQTVINGAAADENVFWPECGCGRQCGLPVAGGGQPRPRLPGAVAVAAAALQLFLPDHLVINPAWLLPALEGALLGGLIAANPRQPAPGQPHFDNAARRQRGPDRLGLTGQTPGLPPSS